MQPNNRSPYQPSNPQVPSTGQPGYSRQDSAQIAAANVARTQIGQLYSQDPNHQMPQNTATQPEISQNKPAESSSNQPRYQPPNQQVYQELASGVYDKTLSDKQPQVDPESWKKYHSSWQNYYQQYFYRYYAGHIQQAQQTVQEKDARLKEFEQKAGEKTQEEVLSDLRSKLRRTVREKAIEVRKSRHFGPIFAALSVMVVFLALQYNSVAFAAYHAYIAPSSSDPVNMIVSPNADIDIGTEPKLIIPKISVDVPIVWDVTPDHDSQMAAMENGVAWFGIPGANSKPGQVGNTVISGHSSNDWTETGDHKFIFARLDRLVKDDTFFINHEGTRYAYTVTKKEVVLPTDVDALIYETDKPVVTLITCTPLGTADKRLLITAEQISPDPAAAKPAEKVSVDMEQISMPGKGQTLFEKIFDALGFGN